MCDDLDLEEIEALERRIREIERRESDLAREKQLLEDTLKTCNTEEKLVTLAEPVDRLDNLPTDFKKQLCILYKQLKQQIQTNEEKIEMIGSLIEAGFGLVIPPSTFAFIIIKFFIKNLDRNLDKYCQ